MHINDALILASTADDLGEGLNLMLVGMLVVFVALTVIGLVITGAGQLLARKKPEPAPVAAAPATPAPAAEAPGIPPHHMAAIVAASTAMLRGTVVVRQVRLASRGRDSWVAQGRAAHHAARNVRRD